MKIRYNGKLYNTDKVELSTIVERHGGYYGNIYQFETIDGTKIKFTESKFTNIDDDVWVDGELCYDLVITKSSVYVVS